MPNEPAESNFKDKVRAIAYPCVERNGIIWTYMGKEATPPALPELEANVLSADRYDLNIQTILRECNYMQALEGDIDTVHSNFLHDGAVKIEDLEPGTNDYYRRSTLAPKFIVSDTDYGATYGAATPAEADSTYWRFANFLFPFYTQVPSGVLGGQIFARAWVPMDEQNTMVWSIRAYPLNADGSHPSVYRSQMRQQQAQVLADRPGHGYLPNNSDWIGRWRLGANVENDYMIDREAPDEHGQLHGHPDHLLTRPGGHRKHGPYLPAAERAPGHNGFDDHSHAPAIDSGGRSLPGSRRNPPWSPQSRSVRGSLGLDRAAQRR